VRVHAGAPALAAQVVVVERHVPAADARHGGAAQALAADGMRGAGGTRVGIDALAGERVDFV
jgi:hypothetical protein